MIAEQYRFNSFREFYLKKSSIKRWFDSLSNDCKYLYRYYVDSRVSIDIDCRATIWNYLVGWDSLADLVRWFHIWEYKKEVEVQDMKIIIKGLPPSINHYAGRTNRWQYQEDKKEFEQLVCDSCSEKPYIDRCKIKIVYFFKDMQRRDPSNFDKFLLDGLVKAGIITDDRYLIGTKGVIEEFTTTAGYDKDNPRTEIYIERIEDNVE